MILLIDNYDSFVHNLARYLQQLGQETQVVRNDRLAVAQIRARPPDAIVISPGPCRPQQAGCSLDVIRQLHQEIPLLGVCLGHQAIGQGLGGRVVRAPEPVHGRTSTITHSGERLFQNLPSPLTVCRYHSLMVDPAFVEPPLRITAQTDDGVVMAVEHADLPVFGVQFHPESVLTNSGYQLLANFLRLAGRPVEADPAILAAGERFRAEPVEAQVPVGPVTF